MNDTTYNGWSNYETWLVSLWLNNEQTSYTYWRDQAGQHHQDAATCGQVRDGIWNVSEAAVFNLADQIKSETEANSPLTEPSLYNDLLQAAMNEVDWHEVAEDFLEDTGGTPPANDDPPLLHTYTRAQAIQDGVLIDVTQAASQTGIKTPTAVSAAVWDRYVSVPKAAGWQNETGRLHDILTMLRYAIQEENHDPDLLFSVSVQNDQRAPRAAQLKAVTGQGDRGEPVITVMLPQED